MSTGLGARFVGRRAELALLETALAAAVAGSPQTVFIGGEAGIGKTRLVNEFAERVQDDARVLTGQCFELSAGGLLYGPAVEMLRKLAQSLDPAVRRELLGPAELELKRMAPTGGGSGDGRAVTPPGRRRPSSSNSSCGCWTAPAGCSRWP